MSGGVPLDVRANRSQRLRSFADAVRADVKPGGNAWCAPRIRQQHGGPTRSAKTVLLRYRSGERPAHGTDRSGARRGGIRQNPPRPDGGALAPRRPDRDSTTHPSGRSARTAGTDTTSTARRSSSDATLFGVRWRGASKGVCRREPLPRGAARIGPGRPEAVRSPTSGLVPSGAGSQAGEELIRRPRGDGRPLRCSGGGAATSLGSRGRPQRPSGRDG